ncbi:MAG: HD-GYP domain-containing protein, partial [Candidatus Hydrogenedentes bacterium]|nr:HD-GYP domain-containing protein [Candidatus Hydrogenedentota bacterium]
RTRPGILSLLMLMVLVGMLNWLVVNKGIVLYLFYLPVVFAALKWSRRDALGVAGLAAVLVISYAFFVPNEMLALHSKSLFWAELIGWGGILVLTAYVVATLKARIQKALTDLQQAYDGVLAILSKFIQTVDADTEAHCVRVSTWATRIAQELKLGGPQVEATRIAGLLHDVGKAEVSVKLLRKAASLSREEKERILTHTTRGAALVKPVGGILASIADTVEAHHEKYDGTGYKGLRGEEIPLLARIVAVADAFDAMLSDRPYRKGVSVPEALASVTGASGADFDPVVVSALQRVVSHDGGEDIFAQLTRAKSVSRVG